MPSTVQHCFFGPFACCRTAAVLPTLHRLADSNILAFPTPLSSRTLDKRSAAQHCAARPDCRQTPRAVHLTVAVSYQSASRIPSWYRHLARSSQRIARPATISSALDTALALRGLPVRYQRVGPEPHKCWRRGIQHSRVILFDARLASPTFSHYSPQRVATRGLPTTHLRLLPHLTYTPGVHVLLRLAPLIHLPPLLHYPPGPYILLTATRAYLPCVMLLACRHPYHRQYGFDRYRTPDLYLTYHHYLLRGGGIARGAYRIAPDCLPHLAVRLILPCRPGVRSMHAVACRARPHIVRDNVDLTFAVWTLPPPLLPTPTDSTHAHAARMRIALHAAHRCRHTHTCLPLRLRLTRLPYATPHCRPHLFATTPQRPHTLPAYRFATTYYCLPGSPHTTFPTCRCTHPSLTPFHSHCYLPTRDCPPAAFISASGHGLIRAENHIPVSGSSLIAVLDSGCQLSYHVVGSWFGTGRRYELSGTFLKTKQRLHWFIVCQHVDTLTRRN